MYSVGFKTLYETLIHWIFIFWNMCKVLYLFHLTFRYADCILSLQSSIQFNAQWLWYITFKVFVNRYYMFTQYYTRIKQQQGWEELISNNLILYQFNDNWLWIYFLNLSCISTFNVHCTCVNEHFSVSITFCLDLLLTKWNEFYISKENLRVCQIII